MGVNNLDGVQTSETSGENSATICCFGYKGKHLIPAAFFGCENLLISIDGFTIYIISSYQKRGQSWELCNKRGKLLQSKYLCRRGRNITGKNSSTAHLKAREIVGQMTRATAQAHHQHNMNLVNPLKSGSLWHPARKNHVIFAALGTKNLPIHPNDLASNRFVCILIYLNITAPKNNKKLYLKIKLHLPISNIERGIFLWRKKCGKRPMLFGQK